ncbi:MAG TPA: PDZ domain-containing protein, partial [Mycobacteriales bacterium]|nr:PDZ domain-containing protein [Mycobacteriales bacterium]
MPDGQHNDGYFRFPAIWRDTIVFVSEDDLWSVPAGGGAARRLTADLADARHPAISPDGQHIAFASRVEGAFEVYVMPADGGQAARRTWFGDPYTTVRGFTADGDILITSPAGKAFRELCPAYAVPVPGGPPKELPYGPASAVAPGPDGAVLIGRSTADPARWKRYRGGTAGRLWIDREGSGQFVRLLPELNTNFGSPMWIGERIYFLSDHEGIGNVYSYLPDGSELRRHTDHETHYARWAATDGTRIVYQHAGEIWLLDPNSSADPARVPIRLAGPRNQLTRRFVDAAAHLAGVDLHPEGHSLVAEVRGKLVTMPLWEEAAAQHGIAQGVRYRLGQFLGTGERLAVVSDENGEEGIDILDLAPGREDATQRLAEGQIGRVWDLVPAPDASLLAITNHRRELLLLNVADGTLRVADEAPGGKIRNPVFSPDSAWIAYSYPTAERASGIRLLRVATGEITDVTTPDYIDEQPSFDPGGKYLYFLSRRIFDPVGDRVQFEFGFAKATKPYLVTLAADTESPFVPKRRPLKPPKADEESTEPETTPVVRIDTDGIGERIVPFPVPEECYEQVIGLPDKVLLAHAPVTGTLHENFLSDTAPHLIVSTYDLVANKHQTIIEDGGPVTVSADRQTMLIQCGDGLRALAAGAEPPKDAPEGPGRESGWIDLDRIRVAVDPAAEWPQMLTEAWRLQRDRFWVPDMSGTDWDAILQRYRPLAERLSTRSEFSDLMWEMQGELGTSHAYELGGDYRPTASWSVGQLGADIDRDEATGLWRITAIADGEVWDDDAAPPLRAPGLNVEIGSTLLAINGQPVDPELGPGPLLLHQAGQVIELTLGDATGANPRRLSVKTATDDRALRYRAWVRHNRRLVHEATGGRVGYIHIPDMGSTGYSEFHRHYLPEHRRAGLIVDVRFNSGGSVSGLLLQKLARPRLGAAVARWDPTMPYFEESPAGPMVCLTNEYAG